MNNEQIIRGWRDAIQDMAATLTVFQEQLATMDNDADFMDAYNDLVNVAGDVLDGMLVHCYSLDDLRAAVAERQGAGND
jgi:hypothetical protein